MKKTIKKTNAKTKTATKGASKALPYVIIRAKDAGVHAGQLVSRNKDGQVVLKDARRLWYWSGAASLSEIAVYGCNPAKSGTCKFAAVVATQEIRATDVCEIIHCQPDGRAMIVCAPVWRA